MNFAKLIYLFTGFYIVIMSKIHSDGNNFTTGEVEAWHSRKIIAFTARTLEFESHLYFFIP